jgi:hypothetical protein
MAVWMLAAFLAISSLLKLSQSRWLELHSKLNTWLQEEAKTIKQKKRLFLTVKKKRQELQRQRELEAAAVEAEIRKLDITKQMEDRKKAA